MVVMMMMMVVVVAVLINKQMSILNIAGSPHKPKDRGRDVWLMLVM